MPAFVSLLTLIFGSTSDPILDSQKIAAQWQRSVYSMRNGAGVAANTPTPTMKRDRPG